jgi:hypothetical protein
MRTPTGLDPLVAFRAAGKLPSRRVSLNLGDEWKVPDWFKTPEFLIYPEGVIRSDDRLVDLDLRVLAGLHVFLHTKKYDDRAAAVFTALQKHVAYVCLVVIDWADDFGIEWRKP